MSETLFDKNTVFSVAVLEIFWNYANEPWQATSRCIANTVVKRCSHPKNYINSGDISQNWESSVFFSLRIKVFWELRINFRISKFWGSPQSTNIFIQIGLDNFPGGGSTQLKNICQIWIISPSRGRQRKDLKPPPSF